MIRNAYPKPTSPAHFDTVHPRELLPLSEPPPSLLLSLPPLPHEAETRSGSSALSSDFTQSMHILPSAYPRIVPFVPIPTSNAALHSRTTLSKEERKAKVAETAEAMLLIKATQVQGGYPTEHREQRLLWNVVTRYYRSKQRPFESTGCKRVTLFLAHGNGLPKETWEPFLCHLIAGLEHSKNGNGNGSISIDEIWSFEAVNHGDAALINEHNLGALFDWADHSRDILNFLTRYLPARKDAGGNLPVHLPRLPVEVENSRIQQGFSSDRTFVGIGHSLGGAAIALTAVASPRLFSHLVLVDPPIFEPHMDRSQWHYNAAVGGIQRRHTWASREEARRLLAESPFFAAWDTEALDNYVEYGTTPTSAPSPGVRLKMSGLHEITIFIESRTSGELFERLKDLDSRVTLHWVMAGKNSAISTRSQTQNLIWRRPSNATNSLIESSGHLIVQEAPRELAHEIHVFLKRAFIEGQQVKL